MPSVKQHLYVYVLADWKPDGKCITTNYTGCVANFVGEGYVT